MNHLFSNGPALGVEYDKEIRPLIDIIDNLRKIGLQQDINLPNVVVVGDQSSGKSSIIEAISGVELPRGTGIVTRCPLELQLVRVQNNEKWKATLTCKQVTYEIDNPAEVGKFVEAGQKKICENEIDISKELLTLRIESPKKNAPDLTLIDLPGITRIPVRGQRSNVCENIKEIIETYIKNTNTVILCVISSNLDLAVNEALGVANKYDPKKERTIGVLTKPDKADKHQKEDIIKLLKNEKFELKKGYIIAKCRSQEDLDKKLSLEKSLQNEKIFFDNDEYFSHMNPSFFGIPNLARKITGELKIMIEKTLPKLKEEINNSLKKCKDEVNELPMYVPEETTERRMYLNKIMNSVLEEIKCFLKTGKYRDKNIYNDWRKIFTNFQSDITTLQIKSLNQKLSEKELLKEIENSRGREFYGFNNYELFEKIVSEHIIEYFPLAETLLKNIKRSTEIYLLQIIDEHLKHLPKINQEIKELIRDTLMQANKQAQNNIELIFDAEKMIFTMDSELQSKTNANSNVAVPQVNSQFAVPTTNYGLFSPSPLQFTANHNVVGLENSRLSSNENAKFLRNILQSYLKIVQSRICDTLPMSIRQWIHIKLSKVLNEKCLKYANSAENDSKIEENSDVKIFRERLMKKYNRMMEAKKSLDLFSLKFKL